jgi:hypothetical protein
MKTTLEIPDTVFRRAKTRAAQRGISFRQFVTDAVREKLITESAGTAKPWTHLAGKLRHLRPETARINRAIEREFERVEPEEWT